MECITTPSPKPKTHRNGVWEIDPTEEGGTLWFTDREVGKVKWTGHDFTDAELRDLAELLKKMYPV